MTESSASQVNFNCPPKLLESFDAAWRASGLFMNRTAAILRSIENFVAEAKEGA